MCTKVILNVCILHLQLLTRMFSEWREVVKWICSSNSNGRVHLYSSWFDLPASRGKGSLMSEFFAIFPLQLCDITAERQKSVYVFFNGAV